MKRSKFTEEQISYALRQVESGTPPADVCRQLGVSEATFYIWKKKYAHLGISELRKLRSLEDEKARLKRVVADLSLDKHILTEALRKKSEAHTAPRAGRLGAEHLRGQLRAGLPSGAVQPNVVVPPVDTRRPSAPAAAHLGATPTRGMASEYETRPPLVSLGRPAIANAGASAEAHRLAPRPGADADRSDGAMEHGFRPRCAGRWPAVSRADGGRSVESTESDPRGGVEYVRFHGWSRARSRDRQGRGTSVDHGTEFISRALEDWAFARGVQLDVIRPGTPVENAFIESFNGRLRDECLNVHQFASIEDARAKIEAWRLDYNQRRPHARSGISRPTSTPGNSR